ncbi:MAG: YheU family protein [Syntrophobacterales bacterium]|nr:MAG: YheU family protein [Syntrophobacterales bacterium]
MRVPYDQLSPEILEAVIEEFILREGTDYGEAEVPFEQKIERVKKQLKSGKALIVFDDSMQSCNILSKSDPRLRDLDREY